MVLLFLLWPLVPVMESGYSEGRWFLSWPLIYLLALVPLMTSASFDMQPLVPLIAFLFLVDSSCDLQ